MSATLLRFAFLMLFLPLFQAANAQCKYTLQMFDGFGDGWNGGSLTIKSGTTTYIIGMDDVSGDGVDSIVRFAVTNGQPLTLSWTPGNFDDEVSFFLFDYEGNVLLISSFPQPGIVFSGTGACPDCIEPDNVRTENVYDTYAKLRWTPVSLKPSLGWWVIYGPKGFVLGPGVGDSLYVTTPKATLTGLSKKTDYDFYVLEMCDSTTFPPIIGPVSFQTYWSNDVGISAVLTPVSGCDLGVEKVTVVMSNYGAKPLSLIPFRFSVNGIDAGVPQPQDGFYTGVLGKDSSTVIEFETKYDFSGPGEYLITVYTQMTGDEETDNDTFNYYIVNHMVAPYFQNFETWSGGWYVDTASSTNSSWELGTPVKTDISAAASGKNAWVTNLDDDYNSFEESYLVSPCFDFSDLTEDPAISFSIIYSNVLQYDGGFLEISTDDGQSWDKVGAAGEGSNWYNFTNTITSLGDVWAGDSEGWKTARIRLFDLAGEANVRFRFGFSSSFFSGEGMGIDDIRVFVPLKNDLAGQSATSEGDTNECGLQSDKVKFTFTNFGTEPQSFFQAAYSINGGAPAIELISATVQPDANYTYTFTTPFDSRAGTFNIKCWTSLLNEQNLANDTAYYTVSHLPKPVPFQENFESQDIPADWTSTGNVTSGHNNISYVLAANLYDFNPDYETVLPRYGIISTGDTFSFDYRITNFMGQGTIATTLIPGTKFDVQVSTDCSNFQTVYSINDQTHVPSVSLKTLKIGLDAFAGQAITIRIRGVWTGGDFFFDLDNVNLRACAADMQLTPDVTPSTNGQNGKVTINVGLGNPPYKYLWSNGATTQTVSNLPVGPITVTVTDALGCTDERTVNVGSVATQGIEGLISLTLQPNPTTGRALLRAVFNHAVDVETALFDLLGRRIWETNTSGTSDFSELLDLTGFPDGIYLVRLTVGRQTVTKKLVKTTY